MPFNGAGAYSPPASDFPAVAATLIESAKFNAVILDLATALSLCLTKDGQQTVTANIPFNGFGATNARLRAIDGLVGTPGITFEQDTDSGFYRIGANNIALALAGAKVLDMLTTGAVFTGSLNWGSGTASFGNVVKRKTADESVTSSTVLQDDDHLVLPIAANEEWIGNFYVTFGSAVQTTGVKCTVTFPAGATARLTGKYAGSGGIAVFSATTTVSGNLLANINPAAGGDILVEIDFWILNGATPGNVTFQFAQETSDVLALTAFKGSYLTATRIA